MNRSLSLALASLFALALPGCGDKAEDKAAGAIADAAITPTGVVDAAARHLRDGDLLAMVQLTVPPAEFERMKTTWREKTQSDPPSEEERAHFAEMMAKLKAPDAEEQLMAEFEPHLAKYDAELAAQMPLMIGMGRGFAVQAIQENKELTAEQKTQATQTLDAVVKWLGETNFSDRERARAAVAEAVETAHAFDVDTLDELQAMEFEQMLQKAGVAFAGIKDVLEVYGLDLDRTFESVRSELVSESGDTAVVKVGYSLFDQPLSFQTEMVRVDGRWYGKDTIEQLGKELDDVEDAAEEASDEAADEAVEATEAEPEQG